MTAKEAERILDEIELAQKGLPASKKGEDPTRDLLDVLTDAVKRLVTDAKAGTGTPHGGIR